MTSIPDSVTKVLVEVPDAPCETLSTHVRMRPKVLILDASQRSALAAVRSLGRAGFEVYTADARDSTLASASRFCRHSVTYPDPSEEADTFVDAIQRAVSSFGITLVIPMTDATTMLLVDNIDKIRPAALAAPQSVSYDALTDKASLMRRAIELQVPVPRTLITSSKAELAQHIATSEYPLVLKPARSRYLAGQKVHSTSVIVVHNHDDAQAALEQAHWLEHVPCLAQEFVPGHGAGIFALGDGTKITAWFAHKRLREKPPSGGVSVLSESAPIDDQMQHYAERLLRSVSWFGPAMVEFRVTEDGTPYLMEVNGRFWGSLQLAIDSGVNFPLLLASQVLNRECDNHSTYRIGHRLRWLLGDVDNLFLQLRSRATPKQKMLACLNFVGTFFDTSCKQEIFRWSDPKPAIVEFRNWLRALA